MRRILPANIVLDRDRADDEVVKYTIAVSLLFDARL